MQVLTNVFLFTLFISHGFCLNYSYEKTQEFQRIFDEIVDYNVANNRVDLAPDSIKKIKDLIDDGANPDVKNTRFGSTVLHFAAQMNDTSLIEYLLHKKAWLLERDCNGSSVLHFAAGEGNTATIAMLVKHGVPIDMEDGQSFPPLFRAIRKSHEQTIRQLIDLKADVNQVVRQWTPLSEATRYNNGDVVAVLIALGAECDDEAIARAATNGHKDVVVTLLGLGAPGGNKALEALKAFEKLDPNKLECKRILSSLFTIGDLPTDKGGINSLIRCNCLSYLDSSLASEKFENTRAIVNMLDEHGISPTDIAMITKNIRAISMLTFYGANLSFGLIDKFKLAEIIKSPEVDKAILVGALRSSVFGKLPKEIVLVIISYL